MFDVITLALPSKIQSLEESQARQPPANFLLPYILRSFERTIPDV